MRSRVEQVATVQKIERFLTDRGVPHHRTGSRAIGGEKEDSDWDICVYYDASQPANWNIYDIEQYVGESFSFGGSASEDTRGESWKSMEYRDINIILVFDKERYNRWHTAMHVSRALELWDKPHRVAMFQLLETTLVDEEVSDYDPIPF